MEDEQNGVTVESPTTNQDVEQGSSPVAPVEATTQEAVQETPEVRYAPTDGANERIRELIQEREYFKQQLAAAVTRPISSQPHQVEADPYAGMDAETKAFYQNVDKRAEQIARKIAAEKEAVVSQELNETRKILATVAYERFQSKHPDVLPNSSEERAIANLYSRGYSLDDAYKVAMFDKVQQGKVQQAQVKQQQTIKQKVAANVETSSIPAGSGLPQMKKRTIREFIDEQISKGQI